MTLAILQVFSSVSIAGWFGIAAASWLVHFLFIRPFVSPLRQIPGLPYKPIIGNLIELGTGQSMEASLDFVRKYGPICRYYFYFGMERVLVADPDVMKQILVTNAKNYIKPPNRMGDLKRVLGKTGLIVIEGNDHASHKKLMGPAFGHNSISKMVRVFDEYARKVAAQWLKAANNTSDMQTKGVAVQDDLQRTTLDVIGKTAFGYEFNSLDNPDHELSKAFNEILTGSGLNWRFLLPFYFDLPVSDALKLKSHVNLMRTTVSSIIEKKRRQIERGDNIAELTSDVLGMMMLAKDEATGRGLSDEELRDEVMTLLSAGHETTAVEMSWCLMMLSEHPEIQERARQEVLSVFPSDDTSITWDRLEQLKYCGNVIKEVLRLFPAVPLTLRQAVASDVFDQKYFIPGGTIILLTMGAMMRRPEIFDEPERFWPERFEDEEVSSKMYNFMPFLVGQRMCLGYKFALAEMKVFLAVFLRRMTFAPLEPRVKYKRVSRITMRPSPSLRLVVEAVKEGSSNDSKN